MVNRSFKIEVCILTLKFLILPDDYDTPAQHDFSFLSWNV